MTDEAWSNSDDEPEAAPTGYLTFYDTRMGEQAQARCELRENQIFRIGRDPRSNDFTIATDTQNMVSRNHCELYAIVYEPSASYHVYVRDRKSINGTYVNDQLIGGGPDMATGFLLDDGDVIKIRPHWRFVFTQTTTVLRHELTKNQRMECQLFLDKYVLTNRCLGQGAEATVYLALHPKSGKQLVCKVVNLDDPKNKAKPEVRRRKFQEADILRQLQHPNILPYVDAIASPHSLYIFTELASGGDLWAFLNRHEYKVEELDARIIIRQVIRGLQYLHKKGIVHRDLKPENILLAYSPKISCHRVLLSDFGASALPQRNRMRTVVGTAGYQAPEQMGDQLQTATADMWSLGMVTLALLAPIANAELQELTQKNQTSLSESINTIIARRETPPSKNALSFVRTCLQVSPTKRITTNDAAGHAWLCTPEKHVEFFRRLDEKTMKGFQIQNAIRAIPWELPDVERMCLTQVGVSSEASSLHTQIDSASSATGVRGAASASDSKPEKQVEGPCQLTSGHIQYTSVEGTIDTPGPNPEALDKCAKNTAISIIRKGDKQDGVLLRKITDATLLPLTGLARHMRKPRQLDHRVRILEELEATKSKFLTAEQASKQRHGHGHSIPGVFTNLRPEREKTENMKKKHGGI